MSTPSFTEAGEQYTKRKHLKITFMEKDKLQMINKIHDLEKTVMINKEIIQEMINTEDRLDPKGKRILDKLNKENAHLQLQTKRVIKERDQAQSKALINEQIIQEYKNKEAEINRDYAEKIQDLTDQLNRKEYILQNYERKYFKAEGMLKKYSHYEQEIRMFLRGLNIKPEEERTISSVVEENEQLKEQVKFSNKEIKSLQDQLEKYTNICNTQEHEIIKLKEGSIPIQLNTAPEVKRRPNSLVVPSLDLGKIRKVQQSNNVAYIHTLEESIKHLNRKITDLQDENTQVLKENHKLQKTTQNLYKLNERLSKALKLTNQKFKELECKTITIMKAEEGADEENLGYEGREGGEEDGSGLNKSADLIYEGNGETESQPADKKGLHHYSPTFRVPNGVDNIHTSPDEVIHHTNSTPVNPFVPSPETIPKSKQLRKKLNVVYKDASGSKEGFNRNTEGSKIGGKGKDGRVRRGGPGANEGTYGTDGRDGRERENEENKQSPLRPQQKNFKSFASFNSSFDLSSIENNNSVVINEQAAQNFELSLENENIHIDQFKSNPVNAIQ
jgi:hypothetical protein